MRHSRIVYANLLRKKIAADRKSERKNVVVENMNCFIRVFQEAEFHDNLVIIHTFNAD